MKNINIFKITTVVFLQLSICLNGSELFKNVTVDKRNLEPSLNKYFLYLTSASELFSNFDISVLTIDPNIKDSLCQVSAYTAFEEIKFTQENIERKKIIDDIETDRLSVLSLLDLLQDPKNKKTIYGSLSKNSVPFFDFLKNKGGSCLVEEFFSDFPCMDLLSMKYLLTDNNLQNCSGNLSKSARKNFNRQLVKELNYQNVERIENMVEEFGDLVEKIIFKNKKNRQGLTSLPMFPVYNVLLKKLKSENVPINLKVRVFREKSVDTSDDFENTEIVSSLITFLYRVQDGKYVLSDCYYGDQNQSELSYILEAMADKTKNLKMKKFFDDCRGQNLEILQSKLKSIKTVDDKNQKVGEVIKAIKDFSLEEIVLSEAANHPQYINQKEIDFDTLEKIEIEPDKISEYKNNIEYYKNFGQENGFCFENPTLCRLYHVYVQKQNF